VGQDRVGIGQEEREGVEKTRNDVCCLTMLRRRCPSSAFAVDVGLLQSLLNNHQSLPHFKLRINSFFHET